MNGDNLLNSIPDPPKHKSKLFSSYQPNSPKLLISEKVIQPEILPKIPLCEVIIY